MIDHCLDVEYAELEDAACWLVEAPFSAGVAAATADEILEAAAKALQVDGEGLWQFVGGAVAGVLNDCGLGVAELEVLLELKQREFFVLLGVAAGRGKCPGP